ncbi:lytic murein transglycosylase [Rhodomicrobium sp. Az07]|uniref:lytic murein transglycosylase n=1 Tax=Rhodomicrobium sp. Az07 TaxID=2839034 RepID=UPI001BE5C951|nr:lytic murein transglycosylase [Rhodomicrobium sp. Az07]MBT3069297.1 lytic murein transglycosylase [Rhodomicrobium sp. Az07]
MTRPVTRMMIASLLVATGASGAFAAPCYKSGAGFDRWLAQFKIEARAQGLSSRALSALDGITFDQSVINKDRAQSVFSQSFLEFSDRMAAKYRIDRARQLIGGKYKREFERADREFGAPGAVISAFWALETDFGANNGNMDTVRSLATLAYDCRRPEKFREELVDVLKIIDRGDLSASEMRGPWAGELGQTQFVPSVYLKYAIDYDGDGHADLIRSAPDVIGSSANYLKALGWRRGEPWLKEARLPESMDWSQADITIQHPLNEWQRMGVQLAGGERLNGDLPASLLLPMGRNGPAFLAFDNFKVFLEWNQSLIYATTVAYLATRIDGAPPVSRGRGVTPFGYEQTKELQRLLRAKGYDVGEVDGKLGLLTRASVKSVQQKLGLPADSYPSPELVSRLRGR